MTDQSKVDPQLDVVMYYMSFFTSFADNVLFEVYDIEIQKFIKFAGTQGSLVMNKHSVVSGLIKMTLNKRPVENLVVLKHIEGDIDFTNPVFIGTVDKFSYD